MQFDALHLALLFLPLLAWSAVRLISDSSGTRERKSGLVRFPGFRNNKRKLMRNDKYNIMEVLRSREEFSLFTALLEITGLDRQLEGQASYTLLASSNDGVNTLATYLAIKTDLPLPEVLSPGWEINLFKSLDPEILFEMMQQSIVHEALSFSVMKQQGRVLTLRAETLTISSNGNLNQNYEIVEPDIRASNGYIHGIDFMLFPEEIQYELVTDLQSGAAA